MGCRDAGGTELGHAGRLRRGGGSAYTAQLGGMSLLQTPGAVLLVFPAELLVPGRIISALGSVTHFRQLYRAEKL
jgi:hypothetical protein